MPPSDYCRFLAFAGAFAVLGLSPVVAGAQDYPVYDRVVADLAPDLPCSTVTSAIRQIKSDLIRLDDALSRGPVTNVNPGMSWSQDTDETRNQSLEVSKASGDLAASAHYARKNLRYLNGLLSTCTHDGQS